MSIEDLPSSIGKGLLAGAIGTAAMTLSSTIEMKVRDREGSTAPADAAEKVLGVEPGSEEDEQKFSQLVHWAYGTGWGAVRGLIAAAGFRGPAAFGAHYALVWGTETVMLPKLDVAAPITEWGAKEVGVDMGHHAVYALATSLAYSWLDKHTA